GAGDRITALRYQVLDVNLARRWREHASGAVGGDDVIAARRVIGRCDLVDLDFEVRVGAGARGNRRDEKRGERARAQIDVRVGRIPDESGGDVGGRGRAANARADGEEFRARDRVVAVEAHHVPGDRSDRESGACNGGRQQHDSECDYA